VKNRTTVDEKSDPRGDCRRGPSTARRAFVRGIYKAELLKRWWVPKSMGIDPAVLRGGCSCRRQVPIGIRPRWPEPGAFFGTYVEVKPYSRLAWTNEEGGEGGLFTTVTFEEKGGKTLVSCARAILRRKRSTLPAPEQPMQWSRRSISWTSFSSPW